MLGLAVVAAGMGLSVYVHALNIRTNPSLPTDAPEIAKKLHPQLIKELCALEDRGKLVLSDELLTEDSLYALVKTGLEHGKYALPLLDWKKWNAESQSKFLNPRHVVIVRGLDGLYVLAHDPALSTVQNPVRESIRFLYNSLASQQYIVLIGKGP